MVEGCVAPAFDATGNQIIDNSDVLAEGSECFGAFGVGIGCGFPGVWGGPWGGCGGLGWGG